MGSNSLLIYICSGGSATYVVDVILSPGVPPVLFDKNHGKCLIFPSLRLSVTYVLDVMWGQSIKLAQAASTSELRENLQNDLLFFEIVPCHFCRA